MEIWCTPAPLKRWPAPPWPGQRWEPSRCGENCWLCAAGGAITQEDGAYWFTPLSFYEAPATPTPEPIPTDTPSPQPTLPPEESSPEPETTPTPEPDPADTPSPQPTLPPEESTPEPEATPTPEPDPADTPSPQPTLPPEESSPEPEATPTPEPDPADTPSPKPDSFTREGDMLVAKPGTTVEDLIAYLKPGTAHIRWPDGTDVVSGRLATGMTAGDYTIAVLGDCTGNGSLSAADLEEAQGLLLEGSQVEGPWRRAADLDGTANSPPWTWCFSARRWNRKFFLESRLRSSCFYAKIGRKFLLERSSFHGHHL